MVKEEIKKQKQMEMEMEMQLEMDTKEMGAVVSAIPVDAWFR